LLVPLLGALLWGCASKPPADAEKSLVDVPANWALSSTAATAAPTPLARWWLRFNDPLLESLEVRAMKANASINSAQAALRQARALREVAAATLWPTLGSSASAQRSSSNPSGLPGGRATSNSFQAGLDAHWELDIFGANRSALRASEALARASIASLGDIQVSIAAEVALDYIGLRSAQTRLAIAQENLASQQETLQITQWRMQAGLVTSLDVEQARTATEQTGALLPALRTNIDQLSHALAVLAGQAPATMLADLASARPIPGADDELAMRMPAETLRQRADVRSAEQQVLAARGRLSQAEAARLPNFSIGGSLGLSALTLGAMTNGASVVGAALGSVSFPVFDGGAARGQINAQQAALEQAQQAYRAVTLVALRDVEDALVALRDDRVRTAQLGGAADAAAIAAHLARAQYESGLVDFQTVLQTQRTQLGTQSDLAAGRADVGSDHVRLYKALGGGWTPVLGTADNRAPQDVQ
jgi:NodT family efflux transporter outer membrane factor (OMF) lipoprotein